MTWQPAAEDRREPPRDAGAPLRERLTGDERLLAAIELHDGPYALWRSAEAAAASGPGHPAATRSSARPIAAALRAVLEPALDHAEGPQPARDGSRHELRPRGLPALDGQAELLGRRSAPAARGLGRRAGVPTARREHGRAACAAWAARTSRAEPPGRGGRRPALGAAAPPATMRRPRHGRRGIAGASQLRSALRSVRRGHSRAGDAAASSRYSPSVENSTMRSSAGPKRCPSRGTCVRKGTAGGGWKPRFAASSLARRVP